MWSKCRFLAGVGIGAGYLASEQFGSVEAQEKPTYPPQPFCTGPKNCPLTRWDQNWDRRDSPELASRFTRNIILIRHGQYETGGISDCDRRLTNLGKLQVEALASRLQQLNLPYTSIVTSTLTRAEETASIIKSKIKLSSKSEPLLIEGTPCAPIPSAGDLREEYVFYQDDPRIEAAFRKTFFRPNTEKDTYEVIVCHANIIRFFICRALQFPSHSWLKWQIPHASVTWVRIEGNGSVRISQIGEIGYLPSDKVTF